MSQTNSPNATHPPRRRWIVLLGLFVLVVAAVPWVLAKTTLRDRLLNAIVNSDDVTVTSANASFGYLTPLSLSGLRIDSNDDSAQIEVAQIHSDHSWLGLLFSRPELGTFRFDNPKINILVDPKALSGNSEKLEDEEPPKSTQKVRLPNLAAEIIDASIRVRTTESLDPPIDLDKIQLLLRLERFADGSILRIDPTTLFSHQRITPELCGHGLQLVAPLLADEVDAEGEFSLRFEHFELPIASDKSAQNKSVHIEGELQLHQASVGLRNTIAKGVSDLILKLVGFDAPDRLTVAKDLIVSFQVVDGRVQHEGLALLLPHGDSSVEFTSSGSVGLDETLDLRVAVKLPDELLAGSELVQRFTKDPIVLAITGTLDEPKIELASSGGLVKSIQDLIQGETSQEVSEETINDVISGAADVVGGLLQGLRDRTDQREEPETNRSLLPNLRDRLRERPLLRNRRDTEPEPATPPESDPPEPIDL